MDYRHGTAPNQVRPYRDGALPALQFLEDLNKKTNSLNGLRIMKVLDLISLNLRCDQSSNRLAVEQGSQSWCS